MQEVFAGGRAISVLFDSDQIAERITELADDIRKTGNDDLLVVSVLKGSFIFAADLLRALHSAGISPQVEFMSLSSYRAATKSSGEVNILRDVESEVANRNVLLLDDILESGRTLAYAKDLMAARGARTVETCVLLEKPGKRATELDADYIGFECPDKFVVGYGMDMAHRYRELPFVGIIKD